jgi:AbrB family looped-hinge helix DNA binding protein
MNCQKMQACLTEYEKHDILHYSYPLGRGGEMKNNSFKQNAPKFYGSTTVGERGQVVIPAEARRDFEITPTTKLLVLGNQERAGIILTKVENVEKILTMATGMLEELKTLQKTLKEE